MLSVVRNKTCMCSIAVVTTGILFTFCIQNIIRMKESLALWSFFGTGQNFIQNTLQNLWKVA
jgi:hypothetical protein